MGCRVLVCDPMPPVFRELLEKEGLEVHEVRSPPPHVLRELVRGYDVLVVRSSTRVTAEVLEAGRRLKLVARAGSGLDNIDVEAAEALGIKVINVPEAVANAVAELTICLILSLLRMVPRAVESLKAGEWEKHKLVGRELEGMRVGVVGLGAVGSLVARKLKALGARVIGYRRNKRLLLEFSSKYGVEPAESLEDLLRRSELVTLHVPYNRETHHLLNRYSIRELPRGAYLVNTSRAWVVEGQALLEALEEGALEGAAIDVHYNEPPREEWEWRLIRHPRVIATPHIGAQTREARLRAAKALAAKILEEIRKL
ncbi:MAG: 3-phosphoglycerate dehydrogenase [Thermoprotei archaeon]|nr:NAD(P)-binding domain-containing protein [Thermoproteales archaeon]RLE88830.1 MAG: 3-phosphoglycerate dehydrogenase [Thermoprotei archaeon]RLE98292.1 MAG: 3-phosphoglycerate dehydrogenase [Thermoprotei archaeon]